MVWNSISYDGSSDLYVVRHGSVASVRYSVEICALIVRPCAGAICDDFGEPEFSPGC